MAVFACYKKRLAYIREAKFFRGGKTERELLLMSGDGLAGLAVVLVCCVLVLGVLVVVAAFGAAVGVNVVAVYISFHVTWLL